MQTKTVGKKERGEKKVSTIEQSSPHYSPGYSLKCVERE
jgi:hypothetical protein